MNKRMNRNRLNIGTYHLRPYARTEDHIRELSECGIDFVISMDEDRKALDLFSKYGVGAIVTGTVPFWWGGDGDNAGTFCETHPLEVYYSSAKLFKDHPAIWGIDIGDEPSAVDFPHYGQVFQTVDRLFPNQFPYLNLYPNYASVAQNTQDETTCQLGTKTYEEHIEKYLQNVPSDYICYDFYLYSLNVALAYKNLCVVADACRRSGRSMWIVLQVNSQKPEVWITENELRFQAYTAMAFGAENITWACYTAGWWHNQVLDEQGRKTIQYDKLRRVNRELHTLGEEYMKYIRNETFFVGFNDSPDMEGVEKENLDSLDTGYFKDVRATDDKPLVIGLMTNRTDRSGKALMIAAADDPHDQNPHTRTVTFKVRPEDNIQAFDGNGKVTVRRTEDNVCEVDIAPCGGVLVTLR